MIIRSSSIVGTNEQFLTELCPLNVEKFQLYAVSVYFLRRYSKGGGGISVSQTSLVIEIFPAFTHLFINEGYFHFSFFAMMKPHFQISMWK